MRWRIPAAILVAVLLPAPIMAIISIHWLEPLTKRVAEQAKAVVPMLSWEQRSQRPTWRQACRRSTDCDSPLACFLDTHVHGFYCTDSECETDSQCQTGFVCRSVETWGGEVLNRCVLEGDRREGERCKPQSRKYASACAAGLLCADWCGRPCEPEEPGSCPEGFFCPPEGGPQGSSCLPTCEARGCPPGQACIRFRQGISVCSVVHGTNCQQSTCPESQVCVTHTVPEKAGAVWMRCELPCTSDGSSCPEGFFCHLSRCVRACEPDAPGTCGPGEKCARLRASGLQACVFDEET
ncbi:hypothetical protein CYFUS_000107 [Cystobacter fuscus]|uniref:Uncharacterized protein n=1 Tax=Cystobacter fuscus TaxID=43 RepID=A0A250ITY1_9BACT|nr:hypothetical protein CYFUS_000107 [Cystobacter fuscus]